MRARDRHNKDGQVDGLLVIYLYQLSITKEDNNNNDTLHVHGNGIMLICHCPARSSPNCHPLPVRPPSYNKFDSSLFDDWSFVVSLYAL